MNPGEVHGVVSVVILDCFVGQVTGEGLGVVLHAQVQGGKKEAFHLTPAVARGLVESLEWALDTIDDLNKGGGSNN